MSFANHFDHLEVNDKEPPHLNENILTGPQGFFGRQRCVCD